MDTVFVIATMISAVGTLKRFSVTPVGDSPRDFEVHAENGNLVCIIKDGLPYRPDGLEKYPLGKSNDLSHLWAALVTLRIVTHSSFVGAYDGFKLNGNVRFEQNGQKISPQVVLDEIAKAAGGHNSVPHVNISGPDALSAA